MKKSYIFYLTLSLSLIGAALIHYLPTHKKASSMEINLSEYLDKPVETSLKEVGAQPIFINIRPQDLEQTYQLLDQCADYHFEKCCTLLKKWEKEFSLSHEALVWQKIPFGIRDKRPYAHRQKEKKYYLQFSRLYGEWVIKNRSQELASIPALQALFKHLIEIEKKCQVSFQHQIQKMILQHPKLEKLYHLHQGEKNLLISIRVITYEEDHGLCVAPHYDKAAMSLVFPSDDDPQKENIIIAPADGSPFNHNKLRRPIRPTHKNNDENVCVLFITGSILEYEDITIPPTPHAVLCHNRKRRHVLIAFCHFPNLDTSHIGSTIVYKDKIPADFTRKFDK